MKEEKLLRKILKDNDYKVTQPRLVVFHLLRLKGPQSPAELARNTGTSINRVSVYRVIDLFEKLGIVRRVPIGWKYKVELSEVFLEHHHHITCLACGKVVAIHEDDTAKKAIHRLAQDTGFTVSGHQLDLQGYCRDCQVKHSHYAV